MADWLFFERKCCQCGINLREESVVVSVTDAILLMLNFGVLLLTLISVIVATVVAIIKRK
ncbi:hypothetical protein IV59_GL002110 [Paucilactobacillus hokkaidonensis]|uniref:Holin-like toxin n=1 Tax=Paucilactobacillus hokkaidonensis TaxID=1193095 RepID=A0ABR5Q5P6_9LACO|nr:hypothetical protein IV59_GL002110 [Paucilactobacillus hokkaidonensis]